MRKNLKTLSKIFVPTILSLTLMISTPFSTLANSESIHPDSELKDIILEVPDWIPPASRAVTDGSLIWQIESKSANGNSYGSWRNGPTGTGASTLTMSIAKGTSVQVSNTISGSYTSILTIGNALGVSINKNLVYTASYSVKIPAGKTYKIQYRPYYKQYKVVQRAYTRLDGKNYKTNQTKTCYVNVFQNWSYRYVAI